MVRIVLMARMVHMVRMLMSDAGPLDDHKNIPQPGNKCSINFPALLDRVFRVL